MDEDIKKKWVEKLRSGEYKQISGYLQADGCYCCLGVLCEVAVDEGIIKPGESPSDEKKTGYRDYYEYDGSDDVLPKSVADWAGIPAIPSVISMFDIEDLHEINDRGVSFNDIADLIEGQL